MCATVSWGAHESFMHPIFVLKNGCDMIHPLGGSRTNGITCLTHNQVLHNQHKMGITQATHNH
jgi:hypothetical protein